MMNETTEQIFRRGVDQQVAGRSDQAASLYAEVLNRQADHAGALANLGALTRAQGRPREAIKYFTLASQAPGAGREVFFNLANALESVGEKAEAVAALDNAIRLDPKFGRAHLKRGILLLDSGRTEEAAKSLVEAARRLAGTDTIYASGTGAPRAAAALFDSGHLNESIGMFKAIAGARPTDPSAQTNLAYVLDKQSRHAEALAAYENALAVDPNNAAALTGVPACLFKMGELEKAFVRYEKALRDYPERDPARRAGLVSSYLMAILYDNERSAESKARAHKELTATWLEGAVPVALPSKRRAGRLRVGYISADFVRAHPVAQFIAPVFKAHRHMEIDQIAYMNRARSGQTISELTEVVETKWVAEWDDERLAAEIASDGVDVLIDLSGHTRASRLRMFARRPAPVSASFIGYPHSTGFKAIDYLLADEMVCPKGSEHLCAETVIRLPHSFLCFAPPPGMPTPSGAHPTGPVVFGSLNHLPKLGTGTIALWADVLKAIPRSRLLVKCGPMSEEEVRERMKSRFVALGIERERLLFEGPEPFAEAMRAYERIDIALDTIPYNGGTTTAHALWMGVPVVSLKSDNFCGRMGASLLTAADHADCIVENENAYVSRASELAADLMTLRAGRRARHDAVRRSKLCDVDSYTNALATAYQDMVAAQGDAI